MGNKDKTEKLFVACSDVFAELINGLVYHGKPILTAKNLLPGPTESIYQGPNTELSNQFQDYSMYDMRGSNPCALYTLENQSSVDTQMPLRCAGYEGAAYRGQYRSGSKRGIYPVINIVLNWSEKPWNAATSIRELLDYSVPQMAKGYLNKNRIHVFDMRFLSRSIRKRFNGDVKVVLDYLSHHELIAHKNQKLNNPEEVMRMLHALSGDERYLDCISFMKEEGGRSVCELLDSMVNKGLQQGIQQGIQQERQQGIQVLITTYKELGITYKVAAAGVKKKYHLKNAEVRKNMEMYW